MAEILENQSLFNLEHTIAKSLFVKCKYPYEVIKLLNEEIMNLGENLSLDEYDKLKSDVWISKTAKIAFTSLIQGPCIIGHNTEVRQGAFIRGGVIIGNNCVIGNSTEVKNSIIFDNVQIPHYNYVGDSILGYKSHMGAGSIASNVRLDKKSIVLKINDLSIETNLKKLGSILGDFVEVGANTVLCPGTVVGPNSVIYPMSLVKGIIPKNSIFKNGEIREEE